MGAGSTGGLVLAAYFLCWIVETETCKFFKTKQHPFRDLLLHNHGFDIHCTPLRSPCVGAESAGGCR